MDRDNQAGGNGESIARRRGETDREDNRMPGNFDKLANEGTNGLEANPLIDAVMDEEVVRFFGVAKLVGNEVRVYPSGNMDAYYAIPQDQVVANAPADGDWGTYVWVKRRANISLVRQRQADHFLAGDISDANLPRAGRDSASGAWEGLPGGRSPLHWSC